MRKRPEVVVESVPLECPECGEVHIGDEWEAWYAKPEGARGKCPADLTASDVTLYNTTSREPAEKLAKALRGKTFMKFDTGVAPAGGSFDVVVGTRRKGTSDEEFRGMLMHVLAGMLLERV